MKRAIVKYGAVTFSYNNAREAERYNPNNDKSGQPHACTVIGWDDTLSAESFVPGGAKLNGGWLVKNRRGPRIRDPLFSPSIAIDS